MDTLIFISLFILILHVKAQANTNTNSCSPINCSNNSDINIQFPFRLQEFQPQHCGLSGFELYCKQNRTIVHFPSYGDLVIKSISYDLKKLDLLDPNNCVHEVFLNLNLSHTPFNYYYILKEYQYLNCSAQLSASFLQVPCLSGFAHHVYVVETSFVMPDFCSHVKTVGIPFSYSPFLSDNTFGLGLTWHLENSQDSLATKFTTSVQQEAGHFKKLSDIANDKALACIILFIFVVVMLLNIKKLSHSTKRMEVEKEKENQKEPHAAILGDYEALKPKREFMANANRC
ncbi:PREDICTED: RING-H2 finger protein ATL22-like [Nicotiana attenuata]|uniref:RING-type E3 ubiquitin transferase n=1 Tax=Nicotiana attenuata TaxID=49451 RepID=A0A314KS69_NICAT|nr:PREDICTED: RING-H2 finger protein ATL22-like [Nicotiana attenuata]OIT32198.1 ring-h2 finger protein atl22 [Nicotiana attenuata]